MKLPVKNIDLEKRIFAASDENFAELSIAVFRFQYEYNTLYRQYCNTVNVKADEVDVIEQIPFIPIQFFKSHQIKTTDFEPEEIGRAHV